jgi:hypothetical protein
MTRDQHSKVTPHAILGVFIALLGVIFTLDNLGLADTESLVSFWPIVPITVGVIMLMHADTVREWVFGSAWMAGGGLLLARNLGWLSFRLKDFLPLLLVALGVRLIWQDRSGRPSAPPPPRNEWDTQDPPVTEPVPFDAPPPIPPSVPSDPPPPPPNPEAPPSWKARVEQEARRAQREGRRAARHWRRSCGWWSQGFRMGDHTPWQRWESWQHWRGKHWAPRQGHVRMVALMSGVERRLRAQHFASAEMTAIMGACELDLRHSEMLGKEAHITAFALWGGIEIRVPEHWVVINRSIALMGGVEDTSRHVESPDRPRLYVQGFALMAGIEIKN